MKKYLSVLLAVMLLFLLSACTGNTDAQTDAVPDTSAYVPVGSVWFEWDSYKIYSSYEDPNEPEPETSEDEEGTTDGTNTVPSNQSYPVLTYSYKDIEQLPVRVIGKVVELRAKF